MTRRGVWACVALAGVAGAGLALWLCGPRGGRGPVRPAGMVETVAADGGRSFVALPPSLPHARPRAALGAEMFHERRLARTPRRVCAACHLLNEGGTDGKVRGGVLTRPAVNAVFAEMFLHDGSVTGLAAVVRRMFEEKAFSGAGSLAAAADRLRAGDAALAARFAAAYPDGLTATNVVDAVVQFAHTRPMLSGGTAFDLFCGGRTNALDAAQRRGLEVFRGNCLSCHDGATLGARQIRRGLKVPALRGVARRRAFFSDGSCARLEEAVDRMAGARLDAPSRAALVALLRVF